MYSCQSTCSSALPKLANVMTFFGIYSGQDTISIVRPPDCSLFHRNYVQCFPFNARVHQLLQSFQIFKIYNGLTTSGRHIPFKSEGNSKKLLSLKDIRAWLFRKLSSKQTMSSTERRFTTRRLKRRPTWEKHRLKSRENSVPV